MKLGIWIIMLLVVHQCIAMEITEVNLVITEGKLPMLHDMHIKTHGNETVLVFDTSKMLICWHYDHAIRRRVKSPYDYTTYLFNNTTNA